MQVKSTLSVIAIHFLFVACQADSSSNSDENEKADGLWESQDGGESTEGDTTGQVTGKSDEGLDEHTGPSHTGSEGKWVEFQLDVNRDVDILFVIDNSGSMAEVQGNLAANFPRFIQSLESHVFDANYRIAVTSTDLGRGLYKWCPQASPDKEGVSGGFISSSCLDRLDDFAREVGSEDEIDMSYAGCRHHCRYTTEQLGILPTTTDADSDIRARPWVERNYGLTNLPEGISVADALACLGPAGIAGCGFEMPLESMARSLNRAGDITMPEHGFIRDQAMLAVIFVTDEADCSVADETIFSEEGGQVFWNVSGTPTSYICWQAGVECINGWCESVDRDRSARTTEDEDEAVLYPIARYTRFLEELEKKKKEIDSDNEIIVSTIAGVRGNGDNYDIVYPDVRTTDPAFHEKFGIGKGCYLSYELPVEPKEGGDGEEEGSEDRETQTVEQFAIPPVRLREFTEHFNPHSMYSICQESYVAALEPIADAILSQIRPACFQHCVEDTDPSSISVEPSCTVAEYAEGFQRELPECQKENIGDGQQRYVYDEELGRYLVPDGADTCYVLLSDPDGSLSPDPHDNMTHYLGKWQNDESCYVDGYNLEITIEQRLGVLPPPSRKIRAACQLARDKEKTCPDLSVEEESKPRP